MGSHMVTAEQSQRERAVFLAFFYDCLLIPPYMWVAVRVGSLTMLAECLRGVLLVTVAVLSWLTLRKIQRGQTGAYDFGMGKIEQVLSVCVAVLLCVSMGFIWYMALAAPADTERDVKALNFIAVALTFANLCANVAPLLPLYRASRTGKSVLVMTQFRAKLAKSIGSIVVTLCVALNQLSNDITFSWWADVAGISIVTAVTLQAAFGLLKSAVPDLLDRTLPEHHQVTINQALARHFDEYEMLKWCRSRQSGSDVEVHIGLAFPEMAPFGKVARVTKAIVDELEAAIPGSRVTVTSVLPD